MRESEAIEVTDATFFFGSKPDVRSASRIEVAQFAYSIARANVGIRWQRQRSTQSVRKPKGGLRQTTRV